MLPSLAVLLDHGDEGLDVVGAALEVDVARVHDQERRLVVVEEEVVVRARERVEPRRVEAALEVPSSSSHPSEEDVRPRLQIDDEVGPDDARPEQLVDALVEAELLRRERQGREDPVAREEVVGDRGLAEEVLLEQGLLLLEPREQEEELRLERVLLPVRVEPPEKRGLL